MFDLTRKELVAYFPLHVEHRRIGPLFPGYFFVRFDRLADQWHRIYRTRGVAGLICHGPGLPTPLPIGEIEDLMARTSARGVVDDPGTAAPVEAAQGGRATWRSLSGLSKAERLAVLYRLFGEGVREE